MAYRVRTVAQRYSLPVYETFYFAELEEEGEEEKTILYSNELRVKPCSSTSTQYKNKTMKRE